MEGSQLMLTLTLLLHPCHPSYSVEATGGKGLGNHGVSYSSRDTSQIVLEPMLSASLNLITSSNTLFVNTVTF